MNQRGEGEAVVIGFAGVAVFAVAVVLTFAMWGCPKYNVYSSRMEGEALLAHAQASKEVAVAEAKARLESSDYDRQAEVLRARGAAQANEIIGKSLEGNEAYLRYLWINQLAKADSAGQVIYVPTEAGLPILEAGRLRK